MAHGLPDYYRGVDIAYQALSQLIVRPKYGGALTYSGAKVVTANEEVSLFNIWGRGMIYGGLIYLDYDTTQKDSKPIIHIDGNLAGIMSFSDMDKYGIDKPRAYIMSLLKFDDTNFVYCAGFSYGITFETQVEFKYEECHGTTPLVYYYISYTLIT